MVTSFAFGPRLRAGLLGLAALAAPGLAGCSMFSGDDKVMLTSSPANLAVDPFLWQGALDTLGFMTIATQDPARGFIQTGWANPRENANERVRVSVQIYPGQISANSVAVGIERTVNGQAASVNPDSVAAVQEAILLRARQIKSSLETE